MRIFYPRKKIHVSSKNSYGHAESSLDIIAENFLREGRNSFAQDPKLMKEKFLLTKKLWYFNMFLWLRTLRFWQSGRVFSDWRGIISTQCSSIIKTKMFSRRTIFAWFVPKDIYIAFLTTPSETFQNKVAEISLVSRIDEKYLFQNKSVYAQSFPVDTENAAMATLLKSFWRKTDFFSQFKQEKHIYSFN